MRPLAAGIFIIAAAGIIIAGCNQNQPPAETPPPPSPAASAVPLAPAPIAPTPIPPATELAVNSVDSVMLSRPADGPMAVVVDVSGTTLSSGWTNPKLAEEPDDDNTVKTYKFVATSPEAPEGNRAPQPIEAEIRIESLPIGVKTIRIVSATNEISVPVAQ
jgi:hypothetical protein